MKILIVRLAAPSLMGLTGEYMGVEWYTGKAILSHKEYTQLSSMDRLIMEQELDVSMEQLVSLGQPTKADKSVAEVKKLKAEVKKLSAEVQALKSKNSVLEKRAVVPPVVPTTSPSTSPSLLKKRRK